MNSIKSEGLEQKKKTSKRIFKTSLTLLLILFVFTMSSPSSFFQIIKPAEAAGTLTSVGILPTNNIVNTRTTYDVMFKTATTGTIKFILISFQNGFDVTAATRLIERSNIGSGSIAPVSGSTTALLYTVSNPVSVPAGTTIRLEIPRIVNSNTAGSFIVALNTINENNIVIDGPTGSPSFPIKAIGTNDISDNAVTNSKIAGNAVTNSKIAGNAVTSSKIADNSITGNDVSPNFMKSKILQDDDVGHAHGWDPGAPSTFTITDNDVLAGSRILLNVHSPSTAICNVNVISTSFFHVNCDSSYKPFDRSNLYYVIVNLPNQVVASTTSSTTSTTSSPFNSVAEH